MGCVNEGGHVGWTKKMHDKGQALETFRGGRGKSILCNKELKHNCIMSIQVPFHILRARHCSQHSGKLRHYFV